MKRNLVIAMGLLTTIYGGSAFAIYRCPNSGQIEHIQNTFNSQSHPSGSFNDLFALQQSYTWYSSPATIKTTGLLFHSIVSRVVHPRGPYWSTQVLFNCPAMNCTVTCSYMSANDSQIEMRATIPNKYMKCHLINERMTEFVCE